LETKATCAILIEFPGEQGPQDYSTIAVALLLTGISSVLVIQDMGTMKNATKLMELLVKFETSQGIARFCNTATSAKITLYGSNSKIA
jgi:hypothetical protein